MYLEHESYGITNVDSQVIGKRSMVAKYFLISHLMVKGTPSSPHQSYFDGRVWMEIRIMRADGWIGSDSGAGSGDSEPRKGVSRVVCALEL
jgi:hypothetical protein